MNPMANELRTLQMRIHRGDRSAIDQFRQDYLPSLRRIIQRATSPNREGSPIARAVRNLISQLDSVDSAESGSQGENSLDRLACRLCDLLIIRFESMACPNTTALQTFKMNVAPLTQA